MDQPPPIRGLDRWMSRAVVPAILGALVVVQTSLFREATSETFDEFTYLRLGVCIFKQGDFPSLASPMCPPLPILLEYAWPALVSRATPGTEDWELEVPGLIRRARVATSILVGVPLAILVHAWLARRRGWEAGGLGGGLVALSPSVLAACSIATTDACFALFAVLALAALARAGARMSTARFLAAGGALGLALGAKQSAAVLFPVAMVELAILSLGKSWGRTPVDAWLGRGWWVGSRLTAWVALAFLVDWALYGFGLAPHFGAAGTSMEIPVVIPMVADLLPHGDAIMAAVRRTGPPLALDTFYGQWEHASKGHPAFLMGRYSFEGWWYFFPVAIAIKSTPVELAMIGLVASLAARRATWRDPSRRVWLVAILVLLGVGMTSKLNIGHRYMLLIYPLMALLVADRIGEGRARRPAPWIAAGLLLLAGQGLGAVGIAPHYLSYFNGFCGGPSEGYRYLVDSSLDWGQDLPSARRELEARGYRKVVLAYFGTANSRAYGLRSGSWVDVADPVAEGFDWLAISATNLQGAYSGSDQFYQRFRGLHAARAGYSIFLYDLKDPRVRAAWAAVHRAR